MTNFVCNYIENPGKKKTEPERKACHYWKDAVANDSAIDWSYILDIIRKRIESISAIML